MTWLFSHSLLLGWGGGGMYIQSMLLTETKLLCNLKHFEKYLFNCDLLTNANQFGFKSKYKTDMCMYTEFSNFFKNVSLSEYAETLLRYIRLNSTMFLFLLYASNVFDRISHPEDFKKLFKWTDTLSVLIFSLNKTMLVRQMPCISLARVWEIHFDTHLYGSFTTLLFSVKSLDPPPPSKKMHVNIWQIKLKGKRLVDIEGKCTCFVQTKIIVFP